MKKNFTLLYFMLLLSATGFCQTWNGSLTTDWNTAGNWTGGVPLPAGNVTIPTGSPRYPKLASNVIINTIYMQSASQLDFNGFSLTISDAVTNYNSFTGATLNNSGAAPMVLNINTGTGGYLTYFTNNVVNGNIVFNLTSANQFNEADGGSTANTYNGNVIFNINGSMNFYCSYGAASNFNGNLTINRTVAGLTSLFNSGAAITGNFSYTNNTTGTSALGNTAFATNIGGTVNIAANYTLNNTFTIYRLINQTNGGTINIQNTTGFDIEKDTLKVTSLSVTGYKTGQYAAFNNNSITGNVTIADDASYTGGFYTTVYNNIITGNTSFTNNGTNGLFEADGAGTANTFNGNTSFTATNSGGLRVCYGSASNFNGNLTVTRTAAGTTQFFNSGAAITGNFSYTNNTSGVSSFGSTNLSVATTIAGTVNIAANYTLNNTFGIYRLINQTNGGTINIQNTTGFDIEKDTLKVTSLSVTGYKTGQYAVFNNNSITGNVTIADDASYTGGFYTTVYNNIITGNTSFTNNGTNGLFEADGAGTANTFNGNTSFTATNSGGLRACYGSASNFNGNLTVTRTAAGITQFFNSGAAITGNFSYTNNTSGPSTFGSGSVATTIGGTVNIAAIYTSNHYFTIYRLINQTSGGTININNTTGFDIQLDTLKVISLSVTGYKTGQYGVFNNNSITGNVTIADDASYTSGYYTTVYNNIITGNSSFTNNGSNILYDAYAANSGNKYIGNVTYAQNGIGLVTVAAGSINEITQGLAVNSATGIQLGKIKFNGSTSGVIDQLGPQSISINELTIEKTGSGQITLVDPVTINTLANFISGNIYTSTGSSLIFPDNIGYIGASASSHVIGTVTKIGDDAFVFPVGGPITLNTVAISAPGPGSSFSAEYKNQNPTIDGYNTNTKAGSFGSAAISNAGYWDVKRLLGSSIVTLTLGFGTNPYEQYPVLSNLKVAHWNGTQWDDHFGATSGTAANGTVTNTGIITSFSPFTIAGVVGTYLFSYGQPGPGPDGSPIKLKGIGGSPGYTVKQLPAGSYTADSIFLVPNGSTTSFRLKDSYGVEKDTTITAPAAPTVYITANGNGTKNFVGWRHFVYMTDGSNNIMGAIRDNDLTLGNTTMNTYFSTANVATAPNGNIFLKRSFKITSQFAPAGTRRVRFYILKTEFNNLQAADPASFPNGINSLTITKYTGPQEDSLFNPIPGGNSIIIPNSNITIVDLGTLYSLDVDVTGFSGFYIGGNQSNLSLCGGSTISVPSNISGATYQWQVDNGGGYTNVTNAGIYSGATTGTLMLTGAPTSIYGYKFRCLVNGSLFSQVYTIKFTATWQGTVNNIWGNTANWSCGILPDANTDVLITSGKPNYPQLGINTTIRTLRANPGTTVTVNTGFNLTIIK